MVAWFLFLRRPSQPPAELTQTRLTFNSSENFVGSGAISPDGKYLAYSDPAGIHLKLLSTGDERLIPKPAGVPTGASWHVQSWFPDGTQLLADASEPGVQLAMWAVSVLGQSARELREGAIAWQVSPDGKRIAFGPVDASGLAREIWVMGSQGENPQKVLALGEGDWLQSVHWSPDGQRLGYIREQPGQPDSIETCELNGASRTVVVPDPDLSLSDFCWLADGRIIYTRLESPRARHNLNLWQISVNGQSGMPAGKPKRVTQEPDVSFEKLYASADGKRLTFLKAGMPQGQIYLGELAAGGTRMNPPRRLTNDEANYMATAWAPDSKAVLFFSNFANGPPGIFKQEISQDSTEPVVAGPGRTFMPRLSPDGAWILYLNWSKTASGLSLMRIPQGGGVSEFVTEIGPNWQDFQCARSPANLCVVLEESQDDKQIMVTAFDPVKGRGKILRTIEKDPWAVFSDGISLDGSTLAISKHDEAEINIRLLSLTGGSDRDITVKDWPNVSGLDWSPDGWTEA
ncbi:MAG TPA: hypothetical protein VI455_00075 [Terriglobia bacterium]